MNPVTFMNPEKNSSSVNLVLKTPVSFVSEDPEVSSVSGVAITVGLKDLECRQCELEHRKMAGKSYKSESYNLSIYLPQPIIFRVVMDAC